MNDDWKFKLKPVKGANNVKLLHPIFERGFAYKVPHNSKDSLVW